VTRRGWAIAIFAAWGASLGWLVKREFFRTTGARLAEAALSVPPGAVYYRLDLGGQQVGFASSTAFRDRFKQTTGISPRSYRRAFS